MTVAVQDMAVDDRLLADRLAVLRVIQDQVIVERAQFLPERMWGP